MIKIKLKYNWQENNCCKQKDKVHNSNSYFDLSF